MSGYSLEAIVSKAAKLPVLEVLESNGFSSGLGLCIECGCIAHAVEPDACEYECAKCKRHSVFGIEELLIYVA